MSVLHDHSLLKKKELELVTNINKFFFCVYQFGK